MVTKKFLKAKFDCTWLASYYFHTQIIINANIFLDFSLITNLKKSGNKNGEPPKKKKKIQSGSEDLNIPDCAVYLRNQVDKIIRQKDAFEIQAILTTLCSDQLLIPDEDMIHSLTEGKDDNSILPR